MIITHPHKYVSNRRYRFINDAHGEIVGVEIYEVEEQPKPKAKRIRRDNPIYSVTEKVLAARRMAGLKRRKHGWITV